MTWPDSIQEIIEEFQEIDDQFERLEVLMDLVGWMRQTGASQAVLWSKWLFVFFKNLRLLPRCFSFPSL